ncbi:PRC-barrel domain-containing protein [Calidifontibacillus oryziterrae]|uniref:PRC-barrel domain-containing protein n=1 Tax=Calidifontibacillus oryziterrae TaxID=1191699 RepID=UPI00037578FC|nr:PRC-barrel domain-containing protein [Calidifontibacillus oryziterrae]
MKKSNQILGLPIISIADGQQVGSVKSLVINPDKGSIDFLTIEHDDWQVSVKAIPFKKVVGIGEYAVTVESESAIIDLNEIPIANQLVNKKIKINGTKVMTRKGELIGEVTEYYVDEDNGQILGTMLKLPSNEVALPSTAVLTFGKDIIIVKEDVQKYFLNSIEELNQDVKSEKNATAERYAEIEESSHMAATSIDAVLPQKSDPFEGVQMRTEAQPSSSSEVQSIKSKQIDILKGKTVTKDIYDKNGNIIISSGTVLTEEDIVKAQEEGPSVIVELSMNVDSE